METYCDGHLDSGRRATRQTSSSRRSGNGKMDSMENLTDHLMAATPFIGTALFGALLQQLKTGWKGWRNFVVSNLSGAFGAWIVYCLVGDLFSPGWGQAVSGMVGYSGGTLVDVALEVAKQNIESYKPKPKSGGPNDNMED